MSLLRLYSIQYSGIINSVLFPHHKIGHSRFLVDLSNWRTFTSIIFRTGFLGNVKKTFNKTIITWMIITWVLLQFKNFGDAVDYFLEPFVNLLINFVNSYSDSESMVKCRFVNCCHFNDWILPYMDAWKDKISLNQSNYTE